MPAADRQAVTQRAGGELDPGDALVADVAATAASRCGSAGSSSSAVEEAALGERRVDRGASMALAHDEAVAVGPVGAGRVHRQDVAVEHGEDVGAGQSGGDVRAAARARHPQDVCAHRPSGLLGRRHAATPTHVAISTKYPNYGISPPSHEAPKTAAPRAHAEILALSGLRRGNSTPRSDVLLGLGAWGGGGCGGW